MVPGIYHPTYVCRCAPHYFGLQSSKLNFGGNCMTEEEKQEIAAFRFSIIHDFIGAHKLEYGERHRLLEKKCSLQWTIPYSTKTSIGKSTILSWVKAYLEGGRRI